MNAPPQGPVDRAPARVGQVLRGKWRLDELLAVGGMASVFAATHRNGKRGAVKLLHYELSLNEESRTRFLREGYVANKVDHEGAVSVLDDDVCEDGTVFLVMELLEGQTLDTVLRSRNTRTFGLGETLRVADRLLDVLAAAHDKGVVHRDIKPENIFITTQGRLKVLDFGIARLRESAAGAGVTRAGDLLGTPSFMSPEQALGNMDAVDGRSDLWSVGATIFRLLTGRPVHDAETVNRVLLAAMTMPAPPIARVLPAVPPDLALIVDRALAFDPGARWPDARSMRAALRAFAERSGIRIEGAVLNSTDEAKARPGTVRMEPPAPAPAASRPLPAAGQPAYTPPPAGGHIAQPPHTPSHSGVHAAQPVYTPSHSGVHTGQPAYVPPPAGVPTGTPPPGSARPADVDDATRVHAPSPSQQILAGAPSPSQQVLAGAPSSQPPGFAADSPSSSGSSFSSSSGSVERRRAPAAPVPFARSLAPPIFAEPPAPPAAASPPAFGRGGLVHARPLPAVTPPPPLAHGGAPPAVTPPPVAAGGASAMSELGLMPDADEDDDDAKTRLRGEDAAAPYLAALAAAASSARAPSAPASSAPSFGAPPPAAASSGLGATAPIVLASALPPAPPPASAPEAAGPPPFATATGERPAAFAQPGAFASTTGEDPAAFAQPDAFASTTGERPTLAIPSSVPAPAAGPGAFASTTGERPLAAVPSASEPASAPSRPAPTFATPTGERPLASAPAFAPSFHTGTPVSRDTIPVDMGSAPPAASRTPSFSTASPVARDVGQAPPPEPAPEPVRRSRRVAPLVAAGAVVVLGGLAALFFAGGFTGGEGAASTGAAAAGPGATASAATASTELAPAPTTPSATPAASPAASSASGDPSAPASSSATAATPTSTASASAAATAPASAAPPKPAPTPTSKRPPPAPSKGDPFSSRKW